MEKIANLSPPLPSLSPSTRPIIPSICYCGETFPSRHELYTHRLGCGIAVDSLAPGQEEIQKRRLLRNKSPESATLSPGTLYASGPEHEKQPSGSIRNHENGTFPRQQQRRQNISHQDSQRDEKIKRDMLTLERFAEINSLLRGSPTTSRDLPSLPMARVPSYKSHRISNEADSWVEAEADNECEHVLKRALKPGQIYDRVTGTPRYMRANDNCPRRMIRQNDRNTWVRLCETKRDQRPHIDGYESGDSELDLSEWEDRKKVRIR